MAARDMPADRRARSKNDLTGRCFELEYNLQDIKKIHETRDPEEANRLLDEGWQLNYISHEPSRSRYVLVKFE